MKLEATLPPRCHGINSAIRHTIIYSNITSGILFLGGENSEKQWDTKALHLYFMLLLAFSCKIWL